MYLFKTSGKTFNKVIEHQKHAYSSLPRNWHPNELILVSKNKVDCSHREKQIQYTMLFDNIRILKTGEVEKYWPGNEGRWKYLFICKDTKTINQPFNLKEIIGEKFRHYSGSPTFIKITPEHEKIINMFLKKVGTT